MTKETVTLEKVCEILKYQPDGLKLCDIDELEQLARNLELHQQMPNIVKAIYKETKARRWLLNRDERASK
jgi:hypothetical protein